MKTKQEMFDSLISEKLGMLRAAAFRLLGNAADVDEAVQDALLTAWTRFGQYNGKSEFSSWVYTITVNLCCDKLRKQKREKEKLAAYAEERESGQQDDEPIQRLSEAVAELPQLYRDAILIGVLSDFSSDKAAEMLGCSVNTLYQRIHKAKQLLKVQMGVSA